MSRRIVSVCLLIAVSATPQVIERTTARLVEVNVAVEDKQGRTVPGLTRDDFTVFDKGSEQAIVSFSVESSGGRSREPEPEPLAPNTFSNDIVRVAGGSVTAVLFDGLNTPVTDQAYARRQILNFLGEIRTEDKVALYALGRGLNVLQDFTNDPGLLRAALKQYKAGFSPEPEPLGPGIDAGPVQLSTWLGELSLNLIDYYARDRALRTVRMLVAIANHLERVPGRKNLVWVSGSFPAWIGRDSIAAVAGNTSGQPSFWPEIERAARSLNRSNLAVYPVDARGLLAPAEFDPQRASISRDTAISAGSLHHTMQLIAARTGGKAFFNNNDLGRAFRQALDDSRVTYTLAFAPSHDEWDGRFRDLRVRVNREGLRLRHRSGYFAQPDEPSDTSYRQAVLSAARWNPIDPSRLRVTVRVSPVAARVLDLDLFLDPADLSWKERSGFREAALDLWVMQIGVKDRELTTTTRLARLRLTSAEYEGVLQSGRLPVTERVGLLPEALLLRILVRDISSGSLGAVSISLNRVVQPK